MHLGNPIYNWFQTLISSSAGTRAQLAESALLILMESRLFDASMADDSQKLYLDPKNITLVIKV